MNCWDILGLAPGAEPRDIKRRFAQLVKIHRPEDDPQGYQRLRQAYEAALSWEENEDNFPEDEEDDEQEDGERHPEQTFFPRQRGPIPLRSADVGRGALGWQNVLERLFQVNERQPENASKQLEAALGELEYLDLKARIRFEEELLINLQQLTRPLLTLAAAKFFRWHLVAAGTRAAIQTAINESCLLYQKIEQEIAPHFIADMSWAEEVECGDKIKKIYYSIRDNEVSKTWFDVVLLLQIGKFQLSSNFLCQLIELVEWSFKPDDKVRIWSLSDRFHALAAVHKQSYRQLIAAINVQNNNYTSSMVVSSYLKAAEQDHAFSYNKLAEKYYAGADVEKDDAQAAYWYIRAAESGHISAQHNVGVLYRDGVGVEKNAQKAFEWYMQAALQGDDKSQYAVGVMYETGSGIEQNLTLAFEWYLKSAEQGNSWSQLELAKMLCGGGTGVEEDLAKAFAWCVKSAGSGYDAAQSQLGIMYFHGWGVAQDYHLAKEWYLKAAGQGENTAQHNLSILYRDGLGVEKDLQKSFEWCYQSAIQGFVNAQNELGHKYYYGQGIPQNYILAYEWFSKAAGQNDCCAQFYLGEIHRFGYIPDSDYQQALYWLNLAAEHNYSHAQYALGMMYFDGAGVEKNTQTAFHYFHAAALQGNAAAQNSLAIMFEDGNGVTQDFHQASKWYMLAGEQGLNDGQFNLALLYKNHLADHRQAVYWFTQSYEQGEDLDAAFMLHKIFQEGGKGVEKDEELSFTWCARAALRGHKKAQNVLCILYYCGCGVEKSYVDAWAWALIFGPVGILLKIKKSMSSEEITQAQALAKDLIIQYELESTFHPLS